MQKITLGDRFRTAGKELVKLNVGNVVKALGLPDYSLQQEAFYTQGQPQPGTPFGNAGWWFSPDGQNDKFFDFSNTNAILQAFRVCAPVSAILLQKAQAYINGVTYVIDAEDKESQSVVAQRIRTLLANPNPMQSWDMLEMQISINTAMYGFTVLLPFKPVGFDGSYAKMMWAVPGDMIEYELADGSPFTPNAAVFKSLTLVYAGNRTPLLLDEVFIFRDNTPSFTNGRLPESRIKLLLPAISNVVGAMQSRGVLIARRGPKFVISSANKDAVGTTALTPDELSEAQQQFGQRYGIMANQSQAIISSASLNLQTVGYDVKELGLMEEVQESSSQICIGLGFPKFLAGLSDPTFNNQDTAEKALYQRFIIPESKNFYGQWNKFFACETYNIHLVKDYTALPVLQENQIDLGKSRYYMNQACQIEFFANIITWNEWRVANNNDAIEGMDKYYYQLLTEGYTFGKTALPVPSDNTNMN